jgi:lysine biosynthesis protein LysW
VSINCVICDTELQVENDSSLGEIVDCDACGVELEVTCQTPLALDVFEEEEK